VNDYDYTVENGAITSEGMRCTGAFLPSPFFEGPRNRNGAMGE